MQLAPTPSARTGDNPAHAELVAMQPAASCVVVTLRPDPQRSATTLVDLTGDGLIVSPIANAHIHTVLSRAGYAQIDLSQVGRWCVAQTVAREMLQTGQGVSAQQAALLVQTLGGWQLMTQDQWVAHQTSFQPQASADSVNQAPKRSGSSASKRSAGPTKNKFPRAASKSIQTTGTVAALPELRVR
jgi:hypothetical protein